MEQLTQILVNVGVTSVVVLAVASALGKHFLAQQLEKYKSKLQMESSAIVEQEKTRLAEAAAERRIVFSKLHEQRAEVVAELYSRVVRAYEASTRLSPDGSQSNLPSGVPFLVSGLNQPGSKLTRALHELLDYFEPRRIFLAEPLCQVVLDAANALESRLQMFLAGDTSSDWTASRDRVREARQKLEAELRGILGAG